MFLATQKNSLNDTKTTILISRAITLLKINEIYPFTTQNHSYQISMLMQSLKKICQKLLNLVTDGRMDT